MGTTLEEYDAAARTKDPAFWCGRADDTDLAPSRQLQMPLVWYLKLCFPGALRMVGFVSSPNSNQGNRSAGLSHPFSTSMLAFIYRRSQPLTTSIVDAFAPFADVTAWSNVLHRSFGDSLTLKALSDGKYDLTCALLRIFPPTDALKANLVAVVKDKGLEEAKPRVLDVFGIEY
ncbi:hypothetical protein H9P43_003975 [Blastocladiella emersonii ATCC 22665]|nr:hypothetical protein H9P43_003975 [Blastocladiella emersonii ATCC 22665]